MNLFQNSALLGPQIAAILARDIFSQSSCKVGQLKPPPVLTGGFNPLKPPRSVLPKVVNTGQYWSNEKFYGWLVLKLVYESVEGS